MTYEEIGSGGVTSLANLKDYEAYLAEGDRSKLELQLRYGISTDLASEIENKLKQAGVADVRVTTGSPLLRIEFTKGFPWLAVIAAIILATIVLLVMIIGWTLFREVIPKPLQLPVALILIGITAIVLVRKRR